MKKRVIIDCPVCYKFIGEYEKKYAPKSMVCPHCKVGVQPEFKYVGKTYKRNYPQEYFENQ